MANEAEMVTHAGDTRIELTLEAPDSFACIELSDGVVTVNANLDRYGVRLLKAALSEIEERMSK